MVIDSRNFIAPLASEPLKMGGVGHFKTQKKKPNFGGHTLNQRGVGVYFNVTNFSHAINHLA
jgi:hypothetical protein